MGDKIKRKCRRVRKKKKKRMRTSINTEHTKALRDNEKQQKCAVNNKAKRKKQGKIDRRKGRGRVKVL